MMDEQGRGQVITFYSYKGGTGRSMALANIACLLATEQAAKGGKPVLAIDWDLEAPGLHRYFEPFLLAGRGDAQDGLIELFEDLRSRVRPGCAPDEEEEMSEEAVVALDVKRFAVPTSYPKLSFLRAGRFDDETYSTRTNTFQWQELYSAAPSLFRMLADRLAEEFSYVLIDSRTGITDTSGICTTLMPEKLVVVFTPNRQSLTGITGLVQRAYAYRRGSDDVRPLVVYPLPSRIETSVPEEMKRWRLGDERENIRGWELQFTELLRGVYELPETFTLARYFDDVQAQHVPPYAYGEPIAVLRERGSERLTLTKSYDTFRGYLVRNAPWDEQFSQVEAATRQATLEQLNRLNEEFRVATEAVRPQAAQAVPMAAPASMPVSAPPRTLPLLAAGRLIGWLVLLVAMLLLILPVVRWYRGRAVDPGVITHASALPRIVADAEQNRPSTTALLLAATLKDLQPSERGLAEEQLRSRLTLMPAPLFRIPMPKVVALSLLGDRLLLLGEGGTLTRIDVATGKELPVPAGLFAAVAERADGTIATVTATGMVQVFRDGEVETADHVNEPPGFFRFGPGGKMLLYATTRGTARIWAVQGGEPQITGFGSYSRAWANGHPKALRPLYSLRMGGESTVNGVFSGNGEVIAVSAGNRLVVVNRERRITELEMGEPRFVALDERGVYAALVFGDGTLVRELASKKIVAEIAAVPSEIAFDAPGKSLLATIPVNAVARFDAQTGVQTGVLSYQDRDVRSVDFLDDGRAITIFNDRIEVAQPLAERAVTTIEPSGPIVETAYDGEIIVVAGEGSVGAWRLELQRPGPTLSGDELVAEVCRRVERDLTEQEWTKYFGSAPRNPVCKTTQEKSSK
jgi:cellulose biosynthesis protein BcsQ